MANRAEHIEQAKHNQEWANLIITTNPKYRDWAITSAFYAALHYAEACFIAKGIRYKGGSRHSFRSQMIQTHARMAFRSYEKLKKACWDVRYLERGSWQSWYSEQVAKNLITADLPKVREELARAFKVDLT